ncbi:MAG: hypothetical protein EOR81_07465 [Mesorhizobium sp.]|nr:MAG: hypothetical protein EOR81_07465 [Mesorhizobium sp.]
MSIRTVVTLAFMAPVFAAGFLVIIVTKETNVSAPASNPRAVLRPFDGKLVIQSIDDLRVANRKIVLCGVAFTKPQSIRAMVNEAVRRDYQGIPLTSKPVDAGTPCDGNVGPKFGDAVVVQCLTPDGGDRAARLVAAGILCGQPTQAGSTYQSCSSGS